MLDSFSSRSTSPISWRPPSLLLIALLVMAASGVADAGSRGSRGGRGGRLGSVVSGVRNSGGSRGGGRSAPSGGRAHHRHAHGRTRLGLPWSTAAGGALGLQLARPSVDLYGGVQSVVESDGSATGEIRLGFDRLALLGRFTGYRESAGRGVVPVSLDLWAAGIGFELTGGDETKIWLEAVASGFRTSPPDRRFGVAGGIRLEHRLDATVSATGAARRYAFGDVYANELVAGVQASILRASYRVVDFDVGPALRGPEIGIAVQF